MKLPEWIQENLKGGFSLRCCPQHGITSAELNLAYVVETDENVDYCHAGEHIIKESEWATVE